MTSTRLFSLLLLLSLFVSSALATTQTDYVDSFSATLKNWNTHQGTTPYLQQASGNSISAYTDHVVDAIFDFADTALTDFTTITSIKLKGQAQTNNEMHYTALLLYGSSGGAWTSTYNAYGDGLSASISFASADLKATINSIARINECHMNATKHNAAGAGTLTLRQVYLEIIYTSTTGVNTSLLMTETLKVSDYNTPEQSLQFYGNESFALGESALAPVSLQIISFEVLVLNDVSISPFALQLIPSEILALLEDMQFAHQTNTSTTPTTPTGPDFGGVSSYLCVFIVTFNSEPTKDVEIKLWDGAGVPLSTLRTDDAGSAEIDLKAGKYDYSVKYLQQIHNGTLFIDSAKKVLIQLISGESGATMTRNTLMRLGFGLIVLVCAVIAILEGTKAKR